MYVTAEEFLEMLHDIRERYRDSHLNLDDPQVMHTLLTREYPEVEGVVPPPSFETIRERYIPEEWRMLIPESRRDTPTISAIGPGEVVSTVDPVAVWCTQVVEDLDSLRTNGVTAMTYVYHRSMGMESRGAMDRARATGELFMLVAMANRRAYLRSISGTTGRRRDLPYLRAQYVAPAEPESIFTAMERTAPVATRTPLPLRSMSVAVRPGYPMRTMPAAAPSTPAATVARPLPTMSGRVRPPAPAATSASPVRTRERLRRMAAQAGSPGSPRRR